MKKLTDEMRKKYLENFGTRCPFCDSDDIDGEDVQLGQGEIWENLWCNVCKEKWVDIYRLVGVEQYV